jgi:uncharacterized HAD superfamily protein
MTEIEGNKNTNEYFNKFQLEEYRNISNSHFESIKQVSLFFRYYLILIAAPVLILTVISENGNGLKSFFNNDYEKIFYNISLLYFSCISIIGFCIYLYVINLRQDAILYAKTVNKVRRYFYQNSDINIREYQQYLELPIISTQPKYSQKTFFIPLILVFTIINGALLSCGLYVKSISSAYFGTWSISFDLPLTNSLIFIIFTLYAVLHIAMYFYLGYRREQRYLKSYSIGVDIDGVLNQQTEHFVEWLSKLRDIDINPVEILEIPVHLNHNLNINDLDERIVFNTKEYWQTLIMKENANKRINDFNRRFGLRIYFFSYRDWPQYGSEESKIRESIISKGYTPLEKGEISSITTKWLDSYGIKTYNVTGKISWLKYKFYQIFYGSNKLVIELGNPYLTDIRFGNRIRKTILNKNRFQGSQRIGFKFFIEDTPENAIKLASFCNYVFLFDEPYNNENNYNFPKNVIRVKNWNEVYSHLKLMS